MESRYFSRKREGFDEARLKLIATKGQDFRRLFLLVPQGQGRLCLGSTRLLFVRFYDSSKC